MIFGMYDQKNFFVGLIKGFIGFVSNEPAFQAFEVPF